MESRLQSKCGPSVLLSLMCFAGALCLAPVLFGAEPKFSVVLDRSSTVVGEPVSLTLKFEGAAPKGLPAIPQIPGLQFAQGVSSSSSTSIGPDGTMSSVTSYALTLVAHQPGDFVIPALSAEVDGRRLQSEPVSLKVLQSDPTSPPPDYANRIAFLWLVLPKKEVFVGEVMVAEMRLYLRSDVRNISETQIPPLAAEGFTASKFIEGAQFQRRVGGAAFRIVPLHVALTAVKTGPLSLSPIKGSVVVNGQRDVFDFFNRQPRDAQRVELSLDAHTINVKPLPSENVPTNFTGIVGVYTMGVSAGPTNVAAGDPITLKVEFSGRGQLEALSLPEHAWADFKVYPPSSRIETKDQLGIQGAKFFEQVVVPQSSEIKEVPSISFSFFDPDQEKYRTLANPPIRLVVRPASSAPAPTIIAASKQNQNAAPTPDIVHIKPRLGSLGQISPPLVQQPWFLALQSVPLLAFVSALIWRKRNEKLANNPRLRRQRQVARVVQEGTAELHRLAADKNSDQFFATLFHLLQEQIGDRLDVPATSITEAVIEERLRPARVSETTLGALQELFQACNFARFAPIKTSQELAAIIPKFESVVRDLQTLKLS